MKLSKPFETEQQAPLGQNGERCNTASEVASVHQRQEAFLFSPSSIFRVRISAHYMHNTVAEASAPC